METQLRPAEFKDIPAILEIINHEIVHSTVVYNYSQRTLEMQTEWFHKKQTDDLPVIVAELDHNVVGYGTYGIFRPWEAYQYSLEHSIYVAKQARGKGIGKLLLNELIRLARDGGYHTMIAGVDASNQGSYDFHKNSGFVEVGRIREVGYKFDRWLDLIFMQLML